MPKPTKKLAQKEENGSFIDGVINTINSLLPFKIKSTTQVETWDNDTERDSRNKSESPKSRQARGYRIHKKILDHLKEINFPNIIPKDGSEFNIYKGSHEEWALLIARMGYHESKFNINLSCDINGNPSGGKKTSFGWLQLGLESNGGYLVIKNNKGGYPQFTVNELRTEDLPIKVIAKLILKRLEAQGNKIGYPTLRKDDKGKIITKHKMFNYFGTRTYDMVSMECKSETWKTFENGNKSSPVLADGCYTNGIYISGKKILADIFTPLPAKDTDELLVQQAAQKDANA